MSALRECPYVAVASSEEQPTDIPLHNDNQNSNSYAVAFDPLDGSSIIGANWAVGSIFGVWPGTEFINKSGRDMVAAAYAVHGPRTVLVIARPVDGTDTTNLVVQEYALLDTISTTSSSTSSSWVLQRDDVRIPESKKIFAPANLRACTENSAYRTLIDQWINERYTLRYSGGMVPDVHHIFTKGGGVFCNPAAPASPAKLRVLYEVLPLAFCVEAAGGGALGSSSSSASNTVGVPVSVSVSALDIVLQGHDDRGTVCLGSIKEVERCVEAMSFTSS